jgi:hypothetical protein
MMPVEISLSNQSIGPTVSGYFIRLCSMIWTDGRLGKTVDDWIFQVIEQEYANDRFAGD